MQLFFGVVGVANGFHVGLNNAIIFWVVRIANGFQVGLNGAVIFLGWLVMQMGSM